MGILSYREIEKSKHLRTRITPGPWVLSQGYRDISGTKTSPYLASAADGSIQQTYSLSHPGYQVLMRHGAGNVGGPFFTRKLTLQTSHHNLQLRGTGAASTFYHWGPLFPTVEVGRLAFALSGGKVPTDIWSIDSAMSRSALNQQGTKMMLSANPTQPAFRAADALAELVADQSLADIPGRSVLKDGKPGLAGEYLNLQFALLPTISDAQKLHAVSQKSQAIMAQFLREAGKDIARTRRAPTSVTSTTKSTGINLVSSSGSALSTYVARTSSISVSTRTSRDVWFEGVYRNLMSKQASDFEKQLKAWNSVYGFAPNPKSLWEATPYSWLIDYFTNAQSFIHASFMAGIDGSVLVRGYVMCTTHVTTEYTWIGDLKVNNLWTPHVLTWVTTDVVKQRESAAPYGIGFSGAALTGKQLSILAALGISRFSR